MRGTHILSSILFCILTMSISACSNASQEPIVIENAWIREAPPGASAMAGYMQISNSTNRDIILHSANSSSFSSIEIHRSVEEDGIYKMIPQFHLHINASSTIELKPGDYHLMLFKPKKALKQGDIVEISLLFSNNTVINTSVPVKKAEY